VSVIALIPARSGSKGIPGKNFRQLGGKTLVQHAVDCARAAGIDRICVSTDLQSITADDVGADVLYRDAALAADDTPMLAVVQDFLARMAHLYTATLPAWTGKPTEQTLNEQIVVLLQPTAVFRTPARVREAIQLLQSTGADSVVSVVPLPLTHHADAQLAIGSILGPDRLFGVGEYPEFPDSCLNRQQREQTYIRDGTVYAFKRDTVARYGHIYGDYCKPLILEPHETCELDTEADWAAVQARWEREHA
jgi:CMP-N,N'-diacetyllegionaminic acid synthase